MCGSSKVDVYCETRSMSESNVDVLTICLRPTILSYINEGGVLLVCMCLYLKSTPVQSWHDWEPPTS